MARRSRLDLLVQELQSDQRQQWLGGTPRKVEEYLSTHPELEANPEALLDLLHCEVCLREELGESPTVQEYVLRFPALETDLVRLFQVHALLRESAAGPSSRDDTVPLDRTLPASPEPSAPLGRIGDYELLCEIAKGGMGVVYKAWQRSLNRTVALKLIRDSELADPEQNLRFRGEAETAARLEHPDIVAVYEVGHVEERHYFAMAYIEGQSLHERIREHPLPPREAAQLLQTVAQAVQFAHTKRVIHRDLKPQNILLDSHGCPKVADFGLAKRLDLVEGYTATGALLGTPSYMSPEQALGKAKELGPAIDIYGLGAVLYAALTGRPPFQAAAMADVLRQVIEQEPVPPRQFNPAIPRDLETICLKCLQKSPARRYGSADEMAADLGRYLRNEPILARPVGRLERWWRWCARNPAVATLSSAAALLVIAVAIISTAAYFREAHLKWIANREKEEARLQEQRAEESAGQARWAEQDAEQALYYSNIALAQHYLEEGDVEPARQILDRCPVQCRHWEWTFLSDLTHRGRHSILTNGPPGDWCCSFSPTGRWIALGGSRGELVLWDDAARSVLFRTRAHEKPIRSIAFSPDGSKVATAGDDQIAKVWAVPDGKLVCELRGHSSPVNRGLTFSPDGRSLASVSDNSTIRTWDATTGKPRQTLSSKEQVFGIAWRADSRRQLALTWNGSKTAAVLQWDTLGGEQSKLLDVHCYNPAARNALSCSADRKRLAVACNGALRVWSLRDATPVLIFTGPTADYLNVALSADGQTLAATAYGTGAQVFDLASGRQVYRIPYVRGLALSSDATRLVLDRVGRVEICPTRVHMDAYSRGPGITATDVPLGWFGGLPVSTNEAVFDTATGIKLLSVGGKITRDQRFLLRAQDDGTLCVRSLATGMPLRQVVLRSPGTSLPSFTISSDGRYLAAVGDADCIRILEISSGQQIGLIASIGKGLGPLQFVPNDDLLAAGYADGRLRLWHWQTGQLRGDLGGHVASGDIYAIRAIAFSADGSCIATGGGRGDGTIRLSRWPSGELLHVLRGHSGGIRCLAFSRDGRRLVSGGDDGTLRLWDAARGQEVLQFHAHANWVDFAAFCADDSAIVSSSAGVLSVWGGLSASVSLIKQWIDLLPWLRPYADPRQTDQHRSIVKVCRATARGEVLPIPLTSAGSYVLRGKFTRTRSVRNASNTVGFLLPAGQGKTMLALNHMDRATSGLDQVAKRGVGGKHANPTTCPVQLVDGQSYTFEARVELQRDQATVTVQLDGREIIRWQGPQTALNMATTWEVADVHMMGLALGDVDLTVEQLEFMPLDGDARWLEAAVPQLHPPAGATVTAAPCTINLLPLLDAEHAALDVTVKQSPEGIELQPLEQRNGRISFPVWPRGPYELECAFTAVNDATTGAVIIIPTGQSRAAVGLVYFGNAGLGEIQGIHLNSDQNPTRVVPSKVKTGQKHHLLVRVVPAAGEVEIAVLLDREPYFAWKGPPADLSPPAAWNTPDQHTVGVACFRRMLICHTLQLKMLGGEAWVLGPVPKAGNATSQEGH